MCKDVKSLIAHQQHNSQTKVATQKLTLNRLHDIVKEAFEQNS